MKHIKQIKTLTDKQIYQLVQILTEGKCDGQCSIHRYKKQDKVEIRFDDIYMVSIKGFLTIDYIVHTVPVVTILITGYTKYLKKLSEFGVVE